MLAPTGGPVAGSQLGAEKSAATKLGLTLDEWRVRRARGLRWCYCCKTWKLIDQFGIDRNRGSGRNSTCNKCRSYKATASRYRITVARARELRAGDRRCEICGKVDKLDLDHSHSTGAVRGELCGVCNRAIGLFRDDAEIVRKALNYLETYDGRDEH